MKSLTSAAVLAVALDLIAKNGKVTNLEIKNVLRDDGYFATQSEVSQIMDTEHYFNNLEFANNGTYREYFLSTNPPATVVSMTSSPSQPKVKAPSVPAEEVAIPNTGDWKAFDASNLYNEMYFKGDCSRNAARYAFRVSRGVDYPDTRAVRVK